VSRLIALLGLVALAGSCDPRKFDDLADSAWVQIAERKDTQTQGDFGVDLLALPPPQAGGARLVVAAGAPPGLAQITLDEKGKVSEQIGFNGELTGRGALSPLDNISSPTSLALYSDQQFLTGVQDRGIVIRYETGLRGGVELAKSGMGTGLAVATGNLGLGGPEPDVVAAGMLSLTLIPDGDSSKMIVCEMKQPNKSNAPPVNYQSMTLARINAASDHDQIVISHLTLDNQGRVLILEPRDIQNGTRCPETGFAVPVPPPVAIAVADLDGNGTPDLVTGSVGSAAQGFGDVRLYLNVSGPGTYEPTALPLSSDADDLDAEIDASTARGSRLLIANIDGDPGLEILVGDPGANVNGVGAAGRVNVYRMGSGCPSGETRGPVCLLMTLFNPDPARNDYFGRAMTMAPFKAAGGSVSNVLAITQKAKLWVYFRVSPSAPDPRK
jgi:hypothetical protein